MNIGKVVRQLEVVPLDLPLDAPAPAPATAPSEKEVKPASREG